MIWQTSRGLDTKFIQQPLTEQITIYSGIKPVLWLIPHCHC